MLFQTYRDSTFQYIKMMIMMMTNKLLEECSFKFDICKLVLQIGILLDRKNFYQFQPSLNR